MTRAKLTKEQKEERRRRKEEKSQRDHLASQLKDLLSDYQRVTRFGPPTRKFDVGQRIRYGSHDNAEILEVVEADGYRMFYLVRCWGSRDIYGTPQEYEEKNWRPWWNLYRLPPAHLPDILSYDDDVRLNFYQSDIDCLLHIHYRGIDYSAEYQRPHVWTIAQRVGLIDSIFNNVDIGRIVIIDRDYLEHGPTYEVLDGKQRLATLVMFSEDRFTYKGMLFSQMHVRDQFHFRRYSVSQARARNLTWAQKLRYFLKLNTEGTPQDAGHLEHVRYLYQEVIDSEAARRSKA